MAPRTLGKVALGIDLGGTKVLAGVVDGAGRIVGRCKLKTPFLEGTAVIGETLVAAAELALREAGVARGRVDAIALAAPGAVNAEKGLLLRALIVVNFVCGCAAFKAVAGGKAAIAPAAGLELPARV